MGRRPPGKRTWTHIVFDIHKRHREQLLNVIRISLQMTWKFLVEYQMTHVSTNYSLTSIQSVSGVINGTWSGMHTNVRLWHWAKHILAVHTFINYQLELAVKISTESLKRRILESWLTLTVISILKAASCVKSRHATGSQDLSKETLRI